MNAEQESQFAASYTQKLYVKYCQEKHDLQGDQIAQWPQWLARQVYEAEARTEVLKNGFRHQVEALEVLREMTGSQNDRNPWLGITAAVGQLQLRVDSLRTQLEEANAVQQGMTEAILGAGVREAEHNATLATTRETLRKVNAALIKSEADKEKLHDTITRAALNEANLKNEICAYRQVVTSLNSVISDLTIRGRTLMGHIYDAITYDLEEKRGGKPLYQLPVDVTEEMKRYTQRLHDAVDHEAEESEGA